MGKVKAEMMWSKNELALSLKYFQNKNFKKTDQVDRC